MIDLKIRMPDQRGLRAVVFENVRNIAERGYDEIIVCRLTEEETEAIRGFIDAGKLRQKADKRRARIAELQEELDRLMAAEAPEPK